ncbi:MAG: ribonuclease T2 [Pararhodobacter sp.]|nr:ribonuclease T2 [Pararhodobacter sp.]
MALALRNAALKGLLALLLAVAGMGPGTAGAQNRAGEFDYYILALSWMPGFCEQSGDARADPRCAEGSGHGWVLHGLWPQHADGSWPEYCPTPQRNPSRRETARQADLFGVAGAAWHQWNKHGRCSGLSAARYYALSRQAMERVNLPGNLAPDEHQAGRDAVLPPEALEAAFIAANPAFDADMLLLTCRGNAIHELRLCLTPALQPRPCDAATRPRACALDAARLPPPR